jgi:hypothetical protein
MREPHTIVIEASPFAMNTVRKFSFGIPEKKPAI